MIRRTRRTAETYIAYENTLICYEGVQLFLGKKESQKYICLAVPSRESDSRFMCAPVLDPIFDQYMFQQIDLYALIKSSKKLFWIDLESETQQGYLLNKISSPPAEWFPDRQVFARSHNVEYRGFSAPQSNNMSIANHPIHIDGRWDAKDLSTFPDLFTDSYSFLYALNNSVAAFRASVRGIFDRYPWRGGFSTVGFYDDLYSKIPRTHRVSIQGMNYNSPGEITLSASSTVLSQISGSIDEFNNNLDQVHDAYKLLHDGMSHRELLGRSVDEIDHNEDDVSFVERATRNLAVKMKFEKLDELLTLSGGNWIVSAKILLSYYRRLKQLFDFLDTGKAVL